MSVYSTHAGGTRVRATSTPQTQAIPGLAAQMTANSAGGFSFALDDWAQLDRFLILGTEGATYYASEKDHTIRATDALKRLIAADGRRVVARIVEISEAGRAPKNDPAIFALALAGAIGDVDTRRVAYTALPRVARTGTHLFQFASASNGLRGWGRGLRRAVGEWYTAKNADQLAYQLIKYQQREGWSHRDMLRLAHPMPESAAAKATYAWAVGKGVSEDAPRLIHVYEAAKAATTEAEMIRLITQEKLTWEFVPGQWLGSKAIWEALLPNLPLGATLRNLARLTANGTIGSGLSEATKMVVARITDAEALRKARIHPIAVLSALKTYAQGHGERGSLAWNPVARITDALDDAFYLSFGNVESTGKNYLLALDVSGSMGGGVIAGVPGLTPREGSAAMAMVTARTEPNYEIIGFTSGHYAKNDGVSILNVTPRMRMDEVLRNISNLPFGSTDCSLPMKWAQRNKVPADAFIVYTDSETYAGTPHPSQALQQYRGATGLNAKLVVVGMVANPFTIADPNDGGMLDVVGFDTATPNLISQFVS